jgi:hypothetical protein
VTVVRFTPDHVRALDRALLTMEAERAAAEKWRIVDPVNEEAMETLADLRDRMLAEQALLAGIPAVPAVDMAAVTRLEEWSRRNAS